MKKIIFTTFILAFSLSMYGQVIPFCFAQDIRSEKLTLRDGQEITFSVEDEWIRVQPDKLEGSALFKKGESRTFLSIEGFKLGGNTGDGCSQPGFEENFLGMIERELKTGPDSVKKAEFFDGLVLIHEGAIGEGPGWFRDYHFTMKCYYYIAGLRAMKEGFETEWIAAKNMLQGMQVSD